MRIVERRGKGEGDRHVEGNLALYLEKPNLSEHASLVI
jgi:hypothetical protein